jgi:hypothetical protein
MAIRRPNPVLWVYYQYRSKLPMEYRDWVLHDGTCRTWLLRVLVRGLVQVAPLVIIVFAGLVAFGDGSVLLAMGSVVLGILVSLRYALSYAEEGVNYRLARHGFPPGHGSRVRRQAYQAAHAEEAEQYRANWRHTTE